MAWPSTVRKTDLKIDTYRGSGPGGQHRNRTNSAVRITHIPTGLSACAEEHKSQGQNKKAAFRRLADKLVPLMKQALQPEIEANRSTERIRTYHEPRQTVKDDRVEGRVWNYEDIMEGKLEDLIEAVHTAIAEKEDNEK